MSSEKHLAEYTMGRTMSGVIGGIAAVVLSILGLAKISPMLMLAVATIAVGVSLLFKGAVIASEYSRLLSHVAGTTTERMEIGGGMSVEMLAGAAGIVLGILALLGLEAVGLEAIAAIVFGSALILGSAIISRLNTLKASAFGASVETQRYIDEMISASMGTQVLVGIAAIVLGILSLVGLSPTTLTLVAMLAIGGASVITGSAVTTKMVGFLHKS